MIKAAIITFIMFLLVLQRWDNWITFAITYILGQFVLDEFWKLKKLKNNEPFYYGGFTRIFVLVFLVIVFNLILMALYLY